jgi:hypothetical protein
MREPIAVLIAGVVIAVEILLAFRWQISAAPGFVYRLDRWTGTIMRCDLSTFGYVNCADIPLPK